MDKVELRACLKRSRAGCEPPHHELNHSDSDPCLGRLRQGLEVFTEPPRAIEPAKGALDDPTPLHHLKALGAPGTFHDHEGPLQHSRDPGDELARVPAIGPDQLQSREADDQGPQHRFSSITVLDTSGMHYHDEEQSQDIDDNVALAPTDTLAAIIAAAPPFSVVF